MYPERSELSTQQDFKIIRTQEEIEEAYNRGLIRLYQQVFSEPPYYEQFTPEEVRNFWDNYLSCGVVVVDYNEEGRVIGFAAAVPLTAEKEVSELAKSHNFNPETDWYHAEVGVDPNYRRQHLATRLINELLGQVPAQTIIMRTQERNEASLGLHHRAGFKIVPGMFQEKESPRVNGSVTTDKRVFLVYRKPRI